MTARWVRIDWASCERCGGDAECLTVSQEAPEFVYDGDEIRCISCGCKGHMDCDGEVAHDVWEDEE